MTRAPQPGDLIAGKYRIESELGRGGMGAVFAVRHTATGRGFAVKLLSPELSGNADAEARFLREAMLASSINHPAIVEVYDVGRDGDMPYMVMKLLEGETLGERLKRGPLPPDVLVELLLPVLHGVAAAHARGVIHRDLKPENIMLARDSGTVQPKILDFGVSKLLTADARTRLTMTGISIGTPLYMSPEQVRGDSNVDARTDVYALGVILYQALTGSLPFDGNNYADLVLKIVTGNAPGIRAWNANLPVELEAVVARAMAAVRDERYASVSDLAADLARFKGVRASNVGARVSVPRPSAAATPFTSEVSSRPSPARSRRALYTAAALGIAAAAAALLWALWPAGPSSGPSGPAAAGPAHPAPAAAAQTRESTAPARASAPSPAAPAPGSLDAPALAPQPRVPAQAAADPGAGAEPPSAAQPPEPAAPSPGGLQPSPSDPARGTVTPPSDARRDDSGSKAERQRASSRRRDRPARAVPAGTEGPERPAEAHPPGTARPPTEIIDPFQ